MNFCNPVFNTRKVHQFLEQLITDYGYDCFEDFSHEDKCDFAALLMEASGDTECITESDDCQYIMTNMRQVMTGINREDAIQNIRDSIVHYYEHTMKILFRDAVENHEAERNEWLDHVGRYGHPDEAYDRYLEEMEGV